MVAVPLLIFIAASSLLVDLPALKGIYGFIIIVVGVVPIYLAIALAYFVAALILRAIDQLTMRWLLMVGGTVSLIIGWQFVAWELEIDPSSNFFVQIRIFTLSTIGYSVAFSCMSVLWWRIANGRRYNPPRLQ